MKESQVTNTNIAQITIEMPITITFTYVLKNGNRTGTLSKYSLYSGR